MAEKRFLAADLGAESGRVMVGGFDGGRLTLSEAHRFDSRPVPLPDGLHTDVLRIFTEIRAGLALAARSGGEIAGVGVDTWGVDFALLDGGGRLLGNPHHYRDVLGSGILERTLARVPRAEIFDATGIQLLELNTLFQLARLEEQGSAELAAAGRLLMISDLFSYWLSGRAVNEYTNATTSQCYDTRAHGWARGLLERLSLPIGIFGEVVSPGTVLGPLRKDLAEETAAAGMPVIAVGGHDTALAVAAVPARAPGFAYVSSGTWSLLGAEIEAPCIGPASLAANFTNEGGVCGTIRFLKNLCGLWLVQESRRAWGKGGTADSYDELASMAADAPGYRSLVDVDAPEFAAPGDMPSRIREFCRRTGQPVPGTKAEIVRCALDSLALKYRYVLTTAEGILGRRLEPLHVVGGGARNRLLCQLAADATGRSVVAGPVEATAAGNVAMQAMAVGELGSLAEARDLVRRSFAIETYEPRRGGAVEDAYARLVGMIPA
jgi:rhamnulokinase